MGDLPKNAVGLKLHRINRSGDLLSCEEVYFKRGYDGVETVLRRAALSGRVEVGGSIRSHFADVLIDRDGTWEETVALDAKSYASLKNHWMRCSLDANTRRDAKARAALKERSNEA